MLTEFFTSSLESAFVGYKARVGSTVPSAEAPSLDKWRENGERERKRGEKIGGVRGRRKETSVEVRTLVAYVRRLAWHEMSAIVSFEYSVCRFFFSCWD